MNPAPNIAPLAGLKTAEHISKAFMTPAVLARSCKPKVTPPTVRAWIDKGWVQKAYWTRKRRGKPSGFKIPIDECKRIIEFGPIPPQMNLPLTSTPTSAEVAGQ